MKQKYLFISLAFSFFSLIASAQSQDWQNLPAEDYVHDLHNTRIKDNTPRPYFPLYSHDLNGTNFSLFYQMDDNDVRENADGTPYYRTTLLLVVDKDGTSDHFFVDNGPYISKDGIDESQRPCMAINIQTRQMFIFASSLIQGYSLEGSCYVSSLDNISFSKETVFSGANSGWWAKFMVSESGQLSIYHFNFAYYALISTRNNVGMWTEQYVGGIYPDDYRIQSLERPNVLVFGGSEQSGYVGSYYLYNPASNLFFCAGNEWGTQASLGEHGLDVELTQLNDGRYTINTQIDNGNNDRFLRVFDDGSVYCDQPATPWALVERSDGSILFTHDGSHYLAYDGSSTVLTLTTNANDAKAQWKLKTKDELIGQLSSACSSNPMDATFLLAGANFGRNDLRNLLWEGQPNVGGENNNMCGEKFNSTFDVWQELNNVPNGIYKVQVQGFYREGADENYQIDPAITLRQNGGEHLYAYFYANGICTPVKSMFIEAGCMGSGGTGSPWGNVPNSMTDASQCFSAGLYEHTMTVNVTDGKLRLGIRKDEYVMNDWTIFDNFRLTYYGMADINENITFADAEVKRICVQNWDTNGDGELSKDEAAAVTDLGEVFRGNTNIMSFEELQYFTGLAIIGVYAFESCSGLTSVTIPNSVTSIGHYAFYSCSGLTSITIGNGVKSIGGATFYGCSSLTSVTIPNSVTSIGGYAFWNCSGLTSITIGNGVTSIGDSAFSGCTSLTSVHISDIAAWCKIAFYNTSATPLYYAFHLYLGEEKINDLVIPGSVTSIGDYVFMACVDLTSVTIPNSVTSIGDHAFQWCSGLTSVTIPNSVTSIGYSTFYGCRSLTSVPISNSVTSIGDYAFTNCYGLTSVTIPNSVTSIGEGAFSGCSGLTSVTIPNSVTSIGDYAFNYCNGLTEVNTQIKEPFSINDNTFNTYTSATLYVPAGTKSKYKNTNGWKNFTNIVEPVENIIFADAEVKRICVQNWDTNGDGELSKDEAAAVTDLDNVFRYNNVMISFNELQYFSGLTCILGYDFSGCSNLTSIIIPNSVTEIGERAFWGCRGLTSITIPNSVTSIHYGAFLNCSGLTSFTIPNSVSYIGHYAFKECSGLTTVIIPNSVTEIGDGTFSGCSSLTYVNIPNSVGSIGYNTFSFCSSLTSVTVPNSVMSIYYEAFSGCSSLTSINLPNSVTFIGERAFAGCNGLTSVTIPNSVTSIGTNPFAECNGLTSIKVGNGNSVFDSRNNCNAIIKTSTNELIAGCKNTIIPSSVTAIGIRAFFGCTGLSSVTIPNNVTSIGEEAFYNCSGLKEVHSLIEEPFAINDNTFNAYTSAILYVPAGTKKKYKNTDGWKNFTNIVEPDYDLSVDDVDVRYGISSTVTINLTGLDYDCMAAGFILELPEEVYLADDSELGYNISLDACYIEDHKVASKLLDSRTFKVAVYSLTNSVFNGGQIYYYTHDPGDYNDCPTMLRINFRAYATKPGVYQGKLRKFELSFLHHRLLQFDDVYFNVFVDRTATEIDNTVQETEAKEDVWYDLNGRRLSEKPRNKGVYIKNGKKVIVK